jgi:hydrogenase expression/formation protein HypD
MRYFLRDKKNTEIILQRIKNVGFKKKIKIMEACGTHTQTIAKFGLKKLLSSVEFTSGPGCPVCVTSVEEFDAAVQISREPNTILTTFGDALFGKCWR